MTKATAETSTTKKVLIIEDEGEMCLVLNILLDGEELELDHVKSILEAEEYFKKENPSIVILDNRLPDGFGVDYISYLKKYHPSVRIIMISGYDSSVKDVALENGADFYLEKPFPKEQLQQSIRALLN